MRKARRKEQRIGKTDSSRPVPRKIRLGFAKHFLLLSEHVMNVHRAEHDSREGDQVREVEASRGRRGSDWHRADDCIGGAGLVRDGAQQR